MVLIKKPKLENSFPENDILFSACIFLIASITLVLALMVDFISVSRILKENEMVLVSVVVLMSVVVVEIKSEAVCLMVIVFFLISEMVVEGSVVVSIVDDADDDWIGVVSVLELEGIKTYAKLETPKNIIKVRNATRWGGNFLKFI